MNKINPNNIPVEDIELCQSFFTELMASENPPLQVEQTEEKVLNNYNQRAISLERAKEKFQAKKYYEKGKKVQTIWEKAKYFVMALSGMDKALTLESSNFKAKFNYIFFKAQIHLDIFEIFDAFQAGVLQAKSKCLVMSNYEYTPMNLDEIEGMVRAAHIESEASFQPPQIKGDFDALFNRIDSLRNPIVVVDPGSDLDRMDVEEDEPVSVAELESGEVVDAEIVQEASRVNIILSQIKEKENSKTQSEPSSNSGSSLKRTGEEMVNSQQKKFRKE